MVDLRHIAVFLKPPHGVGNSICQELARGENKAPTYTPCIVPELSKSPRPVASQARATALAKWQSGARQAQRASEPHLPPSQAWLLYQPRFIFTAEICGAWLLFGGLAALLNHLSIALRLSNVDAMAVALSHDRLSMTFFAEKARAVDEGSSQPLPEAGNEFSKMPSVEQKHFRQLDLLGNPRIIADPKKGPEAYQNIS